MRRGRAILLWVGVPLLGYWVVMTGLDWRLTRAAAGEPCTAYVREDLVGAGHDFSPRTNEERLLKPAQVRSAGGQPYPDCTISNTSYRCHQVGPAMVQVSHYGKYRYFEVPDGKMAVLYGREGLANCVLQPVGAESG